jgi:hypothetical protein
VRISSEHLYVSLAISVLLIMGSTGNSAILRPNKGNGWRVQHKDEEKKYGKGRE